MRYEDQSPDLSENRRRRAAMRSRSRYRQVRLTATAEVSGRVSWALSAKPLNAAWDEHAVILRGSSMLDLIVEDETTVADFAGVLLRHVLVKLPPE